MLGPRGKNSYGHVYLIMNLLNRKVYVGGTTNAFLRWTIHKHDAFYDDNKEGTLHYDMDKFGVQNFTLTRVAIAKNEVHLRRLEKQWIKSMDACNPEKGYNKTERCQLITEETRKKLSISTIKSRMKLSKVLKKKRS